MCFHKQCTVLALKMNVCIEVVSTGEPRECRHCGQVMKGNVIKILGQAQHMPCGRNETKGELFLCIHLRQLSRAIYRQWKIISASHAKTGILGRWAASHLEASGFFFLNRKGAKGSNGCFWSNGAELLVSTSYLCRTLHKNSQHSFCKWEKGKERWRYLPMLPGHSRNEFSALFPVHSARAQ